MALRKFAAVGAAAAALALAATPAFASSVTVSVGGSTANADHAITATAKGNTVLTANGQTLTCTGSTLGGTVHGGTSKDPVADITAATWSGCDFSGISATVAVSGASWHLHANSGYTTAANDTVAGTLDNISGVTVTIGGVCSFTVGGSVDGTFKEDNGKGGQELDVTNSHLTVTSVNSTILCAGLIHSGDAATFTGAYNLDNTANGYINIEP